jgi:hypothetical protein
MCALYWMMLLWSAIVVMANVFSRGIVRFRRDMVHAVVFRRLSCSSIFPATRKLARFLGDSM